MSASTAKPLLKLNGIHKRYPGVHALKGVSLEVQRGEVHAIVGENGAGKSTLMQILAGVHKPDEGSLIFDGVERNGFENELVAQAAGVAIVFQERSLFGPLSIAENVFAGRQPTNTLGMVRKRQLEDETAKILERIGVNLKPSDTVESLSPGEQQLIEIAKALSLDAKLLILDEPTAALTPNETNILFTVVRDLKSKGVSILYISHRLEEIFALADHVTILKDGAGQGTFPISQVNNELLIQKMVGREVVFDRPEGHNPKQSVQRTALEVRNLTDKSSENRVTLQDISFKVAAGEILGLGGLVGAGRTETALGIFGARAGCVGEIRLNEETVYVGSPRDAVAVGIGYVPEDRKDAGLFLEMGIANNLAATTLSQSGSLFLSDVQQEKTADEYREKLKIASRGGEEPVRALSGGNQQKVLLARWLMMSPKVLIVDEPTRGVDVGAKREVHAILFELARKGVAVIVISSDLPELIALADRVVVLRMGRVMGELSREKMSEEAIVRLSSGVN